MFGSLLQAAELSDGDQKQAVARVYTQEQQAKMAALKTLLYKNRDDDLWWTRKKYIRKAIEKDQIHPDDIECYRRGRAAPLKDAVFFSDEAFTHYLLKKGATPNATEGYSEHYCLFDATTLPIAQLLLDHKARVNGKSYGNKTLLHYWECRNDPRLALLYYKWGINLEELNSGGVSAVMQHLISPWDFSSSNSGGNFKKLIYYLVALGSPLYPVKDFIRGPQCYQEILRRRSSPCYGSDQMEQKVYGELLSIIEETQADVCATTIMRQVGLKDELGKVMPFVGPLSIILSYDDPQDHILPMPIVKELEKLDDDLNKLARKQQESESGCVIL